MSKQLKFPDGFYWGAATASYQVEGGIENNDWAQEAARVNKEGDNIGRVPPAGKACDHYNKYPEDFAMAKDLGHNAHRISIEWARIEPVEGEFDQNEIAHYRKVLEELRSLGLKPFVTLWHFTLPTWFSDKGGFAQQNSPEIFNRYCQFVINELNDLCDNWTTINEPLVFSTNGHLRGNWPPFKNNIFLETKVRNNLIKGHILVYKNAKESFPNIEVGIVKDNIRFSNNHWPWNILIRAFIDWWWNHQFLMKIEKHTDFIGLNYYFHSKFGGDLNLPRSDFGWEMDPESIYNVLMDLKRYDVPIYITEAGLSDEQDQYRAEYIRGLVKGTHKAIENGLPVLGFMYWSLIDNFEWAVGYQQHFGLISFDMETQKRTIRKSAAVYKEICESNALAVE